MKPQVLLQYYMMVDDLRKIVEESFRMMGYKQVKPEQWTVIKAFVSGVDVFVALPTFFSFVSLFKTWIHKGNTLLENSPVVSTLLCFLSFLLFVLTPLPRQ